MENEFFFVILIFLYLILCFVVGATATSIGRRFKVFFILSFLLSPIVGFVVLSIIGESKYAINYDYIRAGITKICPYCANVIRKKAIVCQYCHRDLAEQNKKDVEIKE